MRMHLRSAVIALLAVCSTVVGQHLTLSVMNAGFEAPAIPANTFATTAPPPGWTVFGNGIDFGFRTIGVLNPNGSSLYSGGAPQGQQVGVAFLLDDPADQTAFAGIEAGLEQILGVPLMPHTTYTLTVEVGNIAVDPNPPNTPFQFTGFPGYRIELTAGGTLLACDDDTLLPAEGTFLTSVTTFTVGASHPFTGQALGIRLVNLDAAPGLEVNFDDVRLVAAYAGMPGQANTAASALTIDGIGAAGVPGPYLVAASGSLSLEWIGQPNTTVVLAIGSLNPANTTVPGVGVLDLGSPPGFPDVALLTAGIGSPTDSSGLAAENVALPPFLAGFFFAAQGFVFTAAAPFVALTSAFHVLVL